MARVRWGGLHARFPVIEAPKPSSRPQMRSLGDRRQNRQFPLPAVIQLLIVLFVICSNRSERRLTALGVDHLDVARRISTFTPRPVSGRDTRLGKLGPCSLLHGSAHLICTRVPRPKSRTSDPVAAQSIEYTQFFPIFKLLGLALRAKLTLKRGQG